jgi:hypothetical protein
MILAVLVMTAFIAVELPAQSIREYTVKRAPQTVVVDGKLNDPGWEAVPFTETFVIYTNGAAVKLPTRCKMLWDNTYLYIAFVMDDPDVWGKTVVWSDPKYCLCSEEVAEIFIDADGDGLNYLEAEINPLGAVMDLKMNKEFSKGGSGDYGWSYQNLKIGITVQGTINNQASPDTSWTCEFAFPFSEIAPTAPSMSFPPKPADTWRINLYRYDYGRDAGGNTPNSLRELSAWNQTDTRGFHAPDKFGRIIFSSEVAGIPTNVENEREIPLALSITGNYPNPFNPATHIEFTVSASGETRLDIFNIAGQKVRTLFEKPLGAGKYSMVWDGLLSSGESAPSGIYFARLIRGAHSATHRMLLFK